MSQKSWGYHLILNIAQCNDNVTKKDCIRAFSKDLLDAIEMVPYGDPVIVHFAEHIPDAAGYSLVQLLMTSALAGHFVDIDLTAYIDIFSCKEFDEAKAIDIIKQHFEPGLIQKVFLKRDAKTTLIPFINLSHQKRLGYCNGCGVCCYSDCITVQEEGIAQWMEMHGLDFPIQAEVPITVLFKKIDNDTIQLTLFEKCKNAYIDHAMTKCRDYEKRPEKCRIFPSRKNQLAYIPQCSFEFEDK